jgi:hypothetical protein
MKYPFYDLDIPNEGSLHRIENEKDACGVGFVANIHGKRSRAILDMAICGVCSVQHRGAVDADRVTGDGAGVLTQIPYDVLLPEVEKLGHALDHPLDLAVGVFFLPHDPWSDAHPHDDGKHPALPQHPCARLARCAGQPQRAGGKSAPHHAASSSISSWSGPRTWTTTPSSAALPRAPGAGHQSREQKSDELLRGLAVHRTIVYKALLLPSSLEKFYTDLQHDDYDTSLALFHQRFSTNTFPTWALSHPFPHAGAQW